MAIVFICKNCNGTGLVERRLWFVSKKVSCRFCHGHGRKVYKKEEKTM